MRFPGRCVVCEQPATEQQVVQQRRGQVTRRLDVPLCGDCARQWGRRSGEEERLRRASWLAAGATGLALLVLVLLALGGAWWLRLIAAIVIGLSAAAVVWWALQRRVAAAALPQTRAVRNAVRIAAFSWRDMTLEFANQRVAAAVRDMNESVPVDGAASTS